MKLVVLILTILLLFSFKFNGLFDSKLDNKLFALSLLYLLLVCADINLYGLVVVKETVVINCLFAVPLLNGDFFVKLK